ncbi:MAG: hypothetical protein NTY19_04695 [Planctomycetota bacterium]|nr:hypothetical protein [Planctomycetota bacterium]
MLGHAIGFLAAYIVGTVAMMYANTAWFGLGDVKFGTGGWELYWPLWAGGYAPVAITAVISVWRSGLPEGPQVALLWGYLVVIFTCMEVSFLLDIDWPTVLAEWALLAAVFFAIARAWREHRIG